MYQSLKHLEPAEFYKAEDIPVALYFPLLALGWLLLHSVGVSRVNPRKELALALSVLGF